MAPKDRKCLSEELGKLLSEAGTVDFMRAALEGAPNMLMQLEAEASAGAARCGRSESRTASLNGARRRQLDTAAGSVQLAIPKLREGSCYPSFLEPRRNVGKALLSVIQ
jgi:transposase-like protein